MSVVKHSKEGQNVTKPLPRPYFLVFLFLVLLLTVGIGVDAMAGSLVICLTELLAALPLMGRGGDFC